jgi:hypothetical protein
MITAAQQKQQRLEALVELRDHTWVRVSNHDNNGVSGRLSRLLRQHEALVHAITLIEHGDHLGS